MSSVYKTKRNLLEGPPPHAPVRLWQANFALSNITFFLTKKDYY